MCPGRVSVPYSHIVFQICGGNLLFLVRRMFFVFVGWVKSCIVFVQDARLRCGTFHLPSHWYIIDVSGTRLSIHLIHYLQKNNICGCILKYLFNIHSLII